MDPSTSPSMPRFRTAHVVLGQLLALLGTLIALLFLGGWIPALHDAALPASMLVGVLTALWARSQRAAFGDDALTVQRPWGDRVIPYADIADAELGWHEPFAVRAPGAAVTLRLDTRAHGAWTVSSTWAELAPAWERVNGPLLARRSAALARGEVLTFTDRSRPPWLGALGTAVTTLFFAAALSMGSRGAVVGFGALLAHSLWGLRRDVRAWRQSRAAGGVELAAEGLREVRAHRDDALGGYRVARGAAQGWILWSDVTAVIRDGGALHITTAQPGLALRITPNAGVEPLLELLVAQTASHRRAPDPLEDPSSPEVQALLAALDAPEVTPASSPQRTGVRVDLAGAEGVLDVSPQARDDEHRTATAATSARR